MFRIELEEHSSGVTIRIEGRFVGNFAEEAKNVIARRDRHTTLTVNLSEVTFTDALGEQTLMWLRNLGARFVADSSYAPHLCECLGLSLSKDHCALARGRSAQTLAKGG